MTQPCCTDTLGMPVPCQHEPVPCRGVPWRHADGAASLSARTASVEIECETCPQDRWPGFRGIAPRTLDAARKRAHRHIAATGHRVTVWQSVIHVYGRDPR